MERKYPCNVSGVRESQTSAFSCRIFAVVPIFSLYGDDVQMSKNGNFACRIVLDQGSC